MSENNAVRDFLNNPQVFTFLSELVKVLFSIFGGEISQKGFDDQIKNKAATVLQNLDKISDPEFIKKLINDAKESLETSIKDNVTKLVDTINAQAIDKEELKKVLAQGIEEGMTTSIQEALFKTQIKIGSVEFTSQEDGL